jgi:hypothetical protein
MSNELGREEIKDGFPQEMAYAITSMTYLTQDKEWEEFWAWLVKEKALLPDVDEKAAREGFEYAIGRLHSFGHYVAKVQGMLGAIGDALGEDGPELGGYL